MHWVIQVTLVRIRQATHGATSGMQLVRGYMQGTHLPICHSCHIYFPMPDVYHASCQLPHSI